MYARVLGRSCLKLARCRTDAWNFFKAALVPNRNFIVSFPGDPAPLAAIIKQLAIEPAPATTSRRYPKRRP